MKNNDIIGYYDYLMQLAISKCNSQTDAEDFDAYGLYQCS